MSPLETTLIIALCTLLLIWIVMLGAVLLIAWRLRKTIMAVVMAVRGMRALHGQVRELGITFDVIKRKMNARTR